MNKPCPVCTQCPQGLFPAASELSLTQTPLVEYKQYGGDIGQTKKSMRILYTNLCIYSLLLTVINFCTILVFKRCPENNTFVLFFLSNLNCLNSSFKGFKGTRFHCPLNWEFLSDWILSN